MVPSQFLNVVQLFLLPRSLLSSVHLLLSSSPSSVLFHGRSRMTSLYHPSVGFIFLVSGILTFLIKPFRSYQSFFNSQNFLSSLHNCCTTVSPCFIDIIITLHTT
uniref:Uncharacterized protein n=1 Tax=Panstrongylus lignarius TaxID=156445 RepID=A0A224XQG4_9HEMI